MQYTQATVLSVSDKANIIWQGYSEDSVGEPALLVKEYNGMIEITQDTGRILLNNETLKALEKLFRAIRTKNLL